ncbi:hypothetical protein JCM24511_09530 [Saitozyma sp. JCM 24511]|nr:hypothetical protein JCM24511_09530 [Saitozyma sp. JCM 24511]
MNTPNARSEPSWQRWRDSRFTSNPSSPAHSGGRHQDHRIGSDEDFDIIIVSLASQDSQTSTLPLAATESDSAAERTSNVVQKHLNAMAREKRRRHPLSDRLFRPFVLSLGGTIETKARDALKLWKSIMTRGVYSLLVRRFSLGLLRGRARCFEP